MSGLGSLRICPLQSVEGRKNTADPSIEQMYEAHLLALHDLRHANFEEGKIPNPYFLEDKYKRTEMGAI